MHYWVTSHDLNDPGGGPHPGPWGWFDFKAPALNLEDIHTPEEELISFSEKLEIFSDTGGSRDL